MGLDDNGSVIRVEELIVIPKEKIDSYEQNNKKM
jgi:hypothetical protein